MTKQGQGYYTSNSRVLGWGEGEIKLDKERVELLDKFVVGEKILDIGCGLGVYVNYLSGKGLEVTGMDFVEEFIKKAKKNMRGNFVLGKAEKLPFKDKQFDTVLLFDILEHTDDFEVLKEVKRVCQKRILLIVPKEVDNNLLKSGVVYKHYIDKSHLREYSEEMIRKMALESRLKLIYIKPVHNLYIDTIFMALFDGSKFLKKVVRKIVLMLLPMRKYPTEYFAVLEV